MQVKTVCHARFPYAIVATVPAVAWWHWEAAKITRHLPAIGGGDLDALERAQ